VPDQLADVKASSAASSRPSPRVITPQWSEGGAAVLSEARIWRRAAAQRGRDPKALNDQWTALAGVLQRGHRSAKPQVDFVAGRKSARERCCGHRRSLDAAKAGFGARTLWSRRGGFAAGIGKRR